MAKYTIIVPELWYTEFVVDDASNTRDAVQQVIRGDVVPDSKYLERPFMPNEEPYLILMPDGSRKAWDGHHSVKDYWTRPGESIPE